MIDIFDKLNAAYGDKTLADSDQIKDKKFGKKQDVLNKEILDPDDPNSLKSKVDSFNGIVIDPDNVVSTDKSDIEVGSSKIPTGNAVAGALSDAMLKAGVFDISAYNLTNDQPTPYADLEAALGNNGENVPEAVRKGGMQVKFIQGSVGSSDNKYVQFRLMSDSFNTTVANWQGVDDNPTAGSTNLVKSGGVVAFTMGNKELYHLTGYIENSSGTLVNVSAFKATDFLKIDKTVPVKVNNIGASSACGIAFYDADFNFISGTGMMDQTDYEYSVEQIPENAVYMRSSALASSLNNDTCIIGASIAGVEEDLAILYNKTEKQASFDIHLLSNIDSILDTENSNLTQVSTTTSYSGEIIRNKKLISFGNPFKVDVYTLTDGIDYYLKGKLAGQNTQAIIYSDAGLTDPIYLVSSGTNTSYGYTDIAFKLTCKTPVYLAVSNNSENTVLLYSIKKTSSINVSELKYKGISIPSLLPNIETAMVPVGTLTGFPDTAQRIIRGNSWTSNIYDVSTYQGAKITVSWYNSAYGIAFSTSRTSVESFNENIGSGSEWFLNITSTTMEIDIPTGAVYMAIAQDLTPSVSGKSLVSFNLVGPVYGSLRGKTCLYIGDSISTANNCKWKGFLETYHKLNYVRDAENQLAPANGGIPLIPYMVEPDANASKTIWYRCANNRMAIYDFDAVSIFGGTNDMVNPNLPVGDVDANGDWIDIDSIKPYVDDPSSFADSSLYTNTWSASLTFTQCLMGCVEMIHRDFPTVPIILPTVLPSGGSYGNTKYTDNEESPVYNMRMSERIAIATMRVANYYKTRKPARIGNVEIVGIPFYWGIRTVESVPAFTSWLSDLSKPDNVHPNIDCARRMVGMFAEMMYI